ncbi:SDR family oxidoreductase [Frankia sp. Mgl5]|uniref:SDR family oxidoreductase n=1 Tax=Frankia sp. Mgl5 TaxID=2933793 RepID=UPI00200EF8AA|nr:SDR family oxidoreductase [Frankia sp. Mgl5]MCK9930612.1 SDR family oxidoreductase [Frankia sp. Mgl5]
MLGKVSELLDDPQGWSERIRAAGRPRRRTPSPLVDSPVQPDQTPTLRRAPGFGQQSDAVLRSLGWDTDPVLQTKIDGAVIWSGFARKRGRHCLASAEGSDGRTMQLRDKVVVITGSGSGLGEACAHRFAVEGATVVVTDIDPAGVGRVSAVVGGVGMVADVSIEEEVQDNARWEWAWKLHVMSHVYSAREVLPAMLERGDGYPSQTASLVALSTQIDKATYSVSKHAALALSDDYERWPDETAARRT